MSPLVKTKRQANFKDFKRFGEFVLLDVAVQKLLILFTFYYSKVANLLSFYIYLIDVCYFFCNLNK
jgi:hypothetical protein